MGYGLLVVALVHFEILKTRKLHQAEEIDFIINQVSFFV